MKGICGRVGQCQVRSVWCGCAMLARHYDATLPLLLEGTRQAYRWFGLVGGCVHSRLLIRVLNWVGESVCQACAAGQALRCSSAAAVDCWDLINHHHQHHPFFN
jgi:hypothetical protein